MRLLIGLLLLSASAFGQRLEEYRDINMAIREGRDVKKADGALWLNRRDGGMVFISDNKPFGLVVYNTIVSMRYDRKNKHTLTVNFRDTRGAEQFVQFELKDGDSRQNLLANIQVHTGIQIDGIGK